MEREDPDLARAGSLTRWLDNRLLDPLIGLVLPGAGDLLTTGVGLYLVAVAVRKRLPAVVIARMLLNLGIDALLGAIPALGDLFDFVFRANRKNLELLEARHVRRAATPSDWLAVGGAALFLLVALAVPVMVLVGTLRWLFGAGGPPLV